MKKLIASCGRYTTPLRGPKPPKNIQVAAVKCALIKTSASCEFYIIVPPASVTSPKKVMASHSRDLSGGEDDPPCYQASILSG